MKKTYNLLSEKQTKIVESLTAHTTKEALMDSNLSEKPKLLPNYGEHFFGQPFQCSSFLDDQTKDLYLSIFHKHVKAVIFKISSNGDIKYDTTEERFNDLKKIFLNKAILNKKRKSPVFLNYMSNILKAYNEGKIIEHKLYDYDGSWSISPKEEVFRFDSYEYRIAENQNDFVSNYTTHCLNVIEAFKNGKQIEKKHREDSDDLYKIDENPEWDFFYNRYRII